MSRMKQEAIVKEFFEQALSYESGTILKITILISDFRTPLMLFCTVNNRTLNDILFISKNIETPFNINKTNIKLYQLELIFYRCLWRNFTIEPYYRINRTMLPLNNDVCGLIEKKMGKSVTLERQYFETNFEKGDVPSELTPEVLRSKYKKEKIIIRINPYDYKNFEVKFINMPEFKIININDLCNNIKCGQPDLPKILGYTL
jgi:hypothetical protein